jgi:superfamily I DNA/RNA helicase
LLSGKHGNLIRCGDINQAITTTFSNADVEGFREFIATAQTRVSMNRSQRCAQGVMDCANNLVEYGKKVLPSAFFDIQMRGVDGKNPVSENPIVKKVFDSTQDERNYILRTIKNIFAENKNATVGLLLRANYQVAAWAEFINNAGFKTITRSDKLEQKAVFQVIFEIMRFIVSPYDNERLALIYEKLAYD